MVKVKISALALDAGTNTPIVLLKQEDGDTILPIWIGYPEASAIALAHSYEKEELTRPLTHDLIKIILDSLDAEVLKVVVDEVDGETYKAKLYLKRGETECFLDARPSDAIAIALRTFSPIYVTNEIFDITDNDGPGANNIETIRKRLRDIDPSDFGKFNI